jgi:hypothetical protein
VIKGREVIIDIANPAPGFFLIGTPFVSQSYRIAVRYFIALAYPFLPLGFRNRTSDSFPI